VQSASAKFISARLWVTTSVIAVKGVALARRTAKCDVLVASTTATRNGDLGILPTKPSQKKSGQSSLHNPLRAASVATSSLSTGKNNPRKRQPQAHLPGDLLIQILFI